MMLLRTFLSNENLLTQLLKSRRALPLSGVRYASDKPELENPEDLSFLPRDEAELEEENAEREARIEKLRDRSGLKKYDRERQSGSCPSSFLPDDYYKSLKFKRQLFGRYGKESGVNPSQLWPSKAELADMKEWEQVAHPYTVQQLLERSKERKRLEEENIREQEKTILERVSKVEDEILQFKARISKQLDKEVAVRQQQEKTMKDLRKHFGYEISPHDPRVAVLMEKRELEEKKAKKEAKKKKKELLKKQYMAESTESTKEAEESAKEGEEKSKSLASEKIEGNKNKKDEEQENERVGKEKQKDKEDV